VAILLEDGAAVLGLVIAAGGILLTYATGNPVWDASGSIIVGRQPSVRSVRDVKTRQLTPEVWKLTAEITLDSDYIAAQLGRLLAADRAATGRRPHRRSPPPRRLRHPPDRHRDRRHRGRHPRRDPAARHIDLEVAHPNDPHTDELPRSAA
jgi:zinc transporter 9